MSKANIKMKNHSVEVMLTEAEIKARITALGHQISQDFCDSENELILVGLLRGSFIFLADLSRAMTLGHEVDFLTVSSYGNGTQSNHDIKILKDLDEDIHGKDVLIVEDIIDTGNTLNKIKAMLALRQPRKLKICTLLDKPSRREVNVVVDYVGFTIADQFVVGFGIDFAQHYRHLPYIGKVTLIES